MNFDTWFRQADMPKKVNGIWVDLEDGIPYSHWATKPAVVTPKPRSTASDDTKSHRDFAKQFGGKALTGTTAQKNWAEKIRAEKLSGVDREVAEILCKHLVSAKAWINLRSNKPSEIKERAAAAASAYAELLILDAELKTLPAGNLNNDQQRVLNRIAVQCQPLNRAMEIFKTWNY